MKDKFALVMSVARSLDSIFLRGVDPHQLALQYQAGITRIISQPPPGRYTLSDIRPVVAGPPESDQYLSGKLVLATTDCVLVRDRGGVIEPASFCCLECRERVNGLPLGIPIRFNPPNEYVLTNIAFCGLRCAYKYLLDHHGRIDCRQHPIYKESVQLCHQLYARLRPGERLMTSHEADLLLSNGGSVARDDPHEYVFDGLYFSLAKKVYRQR
jgi:hypothetical protein